MTILNDMIGQCPLFDELTSSPCGFLAGLRVFNLSRGVGGAPCGGRSLVSTGLETKQYGLGVQRYLLLEMWVLSFVSAV